MNVKISGQNLLSEKNLSANFLIWFISGLYLLGMVWFLLSTWAATVHMILRRG